MTDPLLELRQVSCERDGNPLFSELDLTCRAGEVIQILGPNGSGKTTLLRVLAGISTEYRGTIHWQGQPVAKRQWDYRQSFLYLGHSPGIKTALSPEENLRWYRALDGDGEIKGESNKSEKGPKGEKGDRGEKNDESAIWQALAAVGLAGYEVFPCSNLSAGQLRRVALARLYLSRAPIWLLDEPFTAIDKAGVAELEALMARHTEAGGLILLTSHQSLTLKNLRQINLLDFPPSPPVLGEAPEDGLSGPELVNV